MTSLHCCTGIDLARFASCKYCRYLNIFGRPIKCIVVIQASGLAGLNFMLGAHLDQINASCNARLTVWVTPATVDGAFQDPCPEVGIVDQVSLPGMEHMLTRRALQLLR